MSAEEDRWHVRIAPGEVKLLTLEQVDDLYRLDVIDEDTLLRRDETMQWLPLRVVAGLDEEEEGAAPTASSASAPSASTLPPLGSAPPPVRSAPPPPSAPPPVRSAPPPPPAPLPPPPEREASERAPSEQAPFVHSPSFVPPGPSARRPSAPPMSFTPPPPSARPVPNAAPPSVQPVPSAPPPSLSSPAMAAAVPVPFAPPALAPRASRGEILLIGLAVLWGLLVTLNRHGALAALFASAGQGATYAGIEASLGGPSFGTPRAVDALVTRMPAPAPSTTAR
ncbi:MAG TPA: hypothetical protein VJN18_25220 [Polyangiaceae bacterium]|nr:hypothetical protein [Polyangiaceae bacterium]